MDSLEKALAGYCLNDWHSFHTPGHKGRKDLFASFLFPDYDLTELPGLDMLHNPQGVIAEAQKHAASVYGAEETFFLVNGASAGNQAMFMALMSEFPGKKIRLDRRAHRSVTNALVLSGLTPEYIAPIIHPDFKLPLGLDEGKFTEKLDSIGAIHVTCPSYYGTVINLKSMIKARDDFAPALPVLVDQAHGAHYLGDNFPPGAVKQGADLVVHSTHKTLDALTQAAMLHASGSRVDRQALKKSLEMLMTSSPNYLLMASLEKAVNSLVRFEVWDDLHAEVNQLRKKLNGPLRILTEDDIGNFGINGVDWSKLLINVSALGISAAEAVEVLRKSFRIEPELWDEENVLFLLGIGNRPEDIRILSRALEALVKMYPSEYGDRKKRKNKIFGTEQIALPPLLLTPREAWLAPKRKVKIKEALGKICGETISIYPPGIPLIAAGEEITPDCLDFFNRAREYNWQGWLGYKAGEILVVKD